MDQKELEKKIDIKLVDELLSNLDVIVTDKKNKDLTEDEKKVTSIIAQAFRSAYVNELFTIANTVRKIRTAIPNSFNNLQLELSAMISELENGYNPVFKLEREDSVSLIYSELDLNERVEEAEDKAFKKAMSIANTFQEDGLIELE